jgi:ribosomal-protein-alanine N-acetyltransferase
MVLNTLRLILRPFREEDIDPLAELMANPDFMRFSLGVFTLEQTAAFLEKVLNWDRACLPSQFAVIMRSNATLVGYCGFFHHEVDKREEIEIGYRLHPAYWNRGLATEAAQAVRDHAFRDLKLPRVISLIHLDNIPSRRVAEKNGMKLEKETVFRGFPTLVFAITREHWQANYGNHRQQAKNDSNPPLSPYKERGLRRGFNAPGFA